MQKLEVPNEPLAKGMVIPLQYSCPSECVCKEQTVKTWHHKACDCPSFISQYGDIFCKNYNVKPECQGYFIRDASFQGASQFLMAISYGMLAAELTHQDDNDFVAFSSSLNAEVIKRWHQ